MKMLFKSLISDRTKPVFYNVAKHLFSPVLIWALTVSYMLIANNLIGPAISDLLEPIGYLPWQFDLTLTLLISAFNFIAQFFIIYIPTAIAVRRFNLRSKSLLVIIPVTYLLFFLYAPHSWYMFIYTGEYSLLFSSYSAMEPWVASIYITVQYGIVMLCSVGVARHKIKKFAALDNETANNEDTVCESNDCLDDKEEACEAKQTPVKDCDKITKESHRLFLSLISPLFVVAVSITSFFVLGFRYGFLNPLALVPAIAFVIGGVLPLCLTVFCKIDTSAYAKWRLSTLILSSLNILISALMCLVSNPLFIIFPLICVIITMLNFVAKARNFREGLVVFLSDLQIHTAVFLMVFFAFCSLLGQ